MGDRKLELELELELDDGEYISVTIKDHFCFFPLVARETLPISTLRLGVVRASICFIVPKDFF